VQVTAVHDWVAHLIRNEGVGGSNPSCGTTSDYPMSSGDVPYS
jgi:hypothetical protein